MAFRSNGPTMLALPAFRGVTRRIILACIIAFFAFWMISSFVSGAGLWLLEHFALTPAFVLHGWAWQLFTYSVFPVGLLGELLALLSVWFIGNTLEDQLGSRWLAEYFFASTVGGAAIATLVAELSRGKLFGISASQTTAGPWPFLMALLLAYARYNAEQEVMFSFVIRLKAKYLAAIYLLYYLGSTILGGDRFGALTAVCAALAGWLYLSFVPRRGMAFAATERWYGLRNAFYRDRRQRAAKKFGVYMRDRGRDVRFDADGKYVGENTPKTRGPNGPNNPNDPNGPNDPNDPNDRRWMN